MATDPATGGASSSTSNSQLRTMIAATTMAPGRSGFRRDSRATNLSNRSVDDELPGWYETGAEPSSEGSVRCVVIVASRYRWKAQLWRSSSLIGSRDPLATSAPGRRCRHASAGRGHRLSRNGFVSRIVCDAEALSFSALAGLYVAWAIRVLTSEDICRSGVSRQFETLRVARNLRVAQTHSHDGTMVAPGCNTAVADKPIMSDRRTVDLPRRRVFSTIAPRCTTHKLCR